jgi:hypothetical protein
MADEEEEVYVTIKPRRIGRYDLPLHFLNLTTSIVGCVHTFFGDLTYSLAAHLMQHREDLEFERIVKNFDNPSSIGPGGPESTD